MRPEDPVPPGVKVLWRPYDKQIEALLRDEEEILYGGAKGGGKTACGIAWLVSGNPASDMSRAADHSYMNHPHYRALVLRRNMIDMGDWIDKAKRVFEPLGATFKERPLPFFEFRSGAKIVLGHLDDSDTYSKYQGQEFQRFLLEEATLVPDLLSYLMVRSCIRSVYPELRAQIFLTANPGGPGHSWVRDRFVRPKDAKGRVIPPGVTIVDAETGLTRIFIAAGLKDNPALMADPAYQKRLMQLPEAQRRAFLDGDWDALSGVYFTEFRASGPLIGEPAEAQHVIASRPLEPWLHRHIGMDWGYAHDGAAYWGCEAKDGRFHVYREMVEKNLGAEKWGAEVAIRSLDDLRGVEGGTMSLYLSPDAWDKRNETRTIADQIADGVRFVLGADSVYLMGAEEGDEQFFQRLDEQKRFGIAIRKAPNQRIAGAAYLRSLLRWWPLTKMDAQQEFDADMFMRLLQADPKRAMEYRSAMQRRETAEVLPGTLIHDCCPRLIDCIQAVLHDEKNPEDVEKRDGDDCYDAWRYLCFARTKERVREPESVFVERRMAAMAATRGGMLDGNTKMWVARKAEADYRGAAPAGIFNVPRLSSRRGMEFWRN